MTQNKTKLSRDL